MKKAEIILASIIAIGFIFRLMHWPYASIILTFGTVFLSLLYIFFGFALLNNLGFREAFKAKSFKGISKLRVFGAVCTGIILSFLIIYILFKVQFWPFGQIGLQQSLYLFGTLLGFVFVFHFMNRKQFLKDNYIRFIIIGVLSVLIYSVSSDQLVDLYYGSDPEYAKEYKAYLKDDSPHAKGPMRDFNSKIEE